MAFVVVFVSYWIIFNIRGVSTLEKSNHLHTNNDGLSEKVKAFSYENFEEDNALDVSFFDNFGYVSIAIGMFLLLYVVVKCLRNYLKSRITPPVTDVSPNIFVKVEELAPPPSYELFAPPNYETVVAMNSDRNCNPCGCSCNNRTRY